MSLACACAGVHTRVDARTHAHARTHARTQSRREIDKERRVGGGGRGREGGRLVEPYPEHFLINDKQTSEPPPGHMLIVSLKPWILCTSVIKVRNEGIKHYHGTLVPCYSSQARVNYPHSEREEQRLRRSHGDNPVTAH